MNVSYFFWTAIAVVFLGWSLGAYNRLIRLRAQVIAAFAPVDQRLGQAHDLLVKVVDTPADPAAGSDAAGGSNAAALESRAGSMAAATQLALSLQVARKQPLDAASVEALRTAYATLQSAWQRVYTDAGAEEPGVDLAVTQRAWEDHCQLTRDAMDTYNQSVLEYNGAIAQFPAVVLAHLFSFRAAACL